MQWDVPRELYGNGIVFEAIYYGVYVYVNILFCFVVVVFFFSVCAFVGALRRIHVCMWVFVQSCVHGVCVRITCVCICV